MRKEITRNECSLTEYYKYFVVRAVRTETTRSPLPVGLPFAQCAADLLLSLLPIFLFFFRDVYPFNALLRHPVSIHLLYLVERRTRGLEHPLLALIGLSPRPFFTSGFRTESKAKRGIAASSIWPARANYCQSIAPIAPAIAICAPSGWLHRSCLFAL